MNELSDKLRDVFSNPSSFVFLGGVHGVGKTTICNDIFISAGFHCVTASSLIKSYKGSSDRDKRVDDVDDNQIALLDALEAEKRKHHRLLLDGHFCLINTKNQLEVVEVDVFEAINPDYLVLLKANPEEIAKRLSKRDGKSWSSTFISQFQETEEQQAQRVSQTLNIPINVIET